MKTPEAALQDAVNRIKDIRHTDSVKLTGISERPESDIYKASVSRDNAVEEYIIKVGKFNSRLKDEYALHKYLAEKGIRGLSILTYSDEHNYLITKKEELTSFLSIIVSSGGNAVLEGYFKKIGEVFGRLRTGHDSLFDKKAYLDYILPRIHALEKLSGRKRPALKERLLKAVGKVEGKHVERGVIIDFHFDNIHFDRDGRLVLVDMGCAEQGDTHFNIAQVYLALKFGLFSRFYEKKTLTERLFNSFLEGYGVKEPSREEFNLYLDKQLIIAIATIWMRIRREKNILKKCKAFYDLWRYELYLSQLMKEEGMAEEGISDYTMAAETYDEDRYSRADDAFINEIAAERVIALLRPDKKMKVLDIGTGTGRGIELLAGRVGKIFGLDATTAMLRKADGKAKTLKLDNVVLVGGNARTNVFKDGAFDAVICLRFIHLFIPWRRQRPFIKEMERVLKADGVIIIEVSNAGAGLVLGLLRKYLFHVAGYNWPWDIYRWSEALTVEKVAGVCLPGAKILFHINKRLARLYSGLSNHFPFNFLSNIIIVKLRKRVVN